MITGPAIPPTGRKRKSRSLRVELNMCLHLLGVDPDQPWEVQHEPPLGIRPFNSELDDYEPGENDFRYMRPMQKAQHKEVTSTVDRPAIDKTRRLAKARQALIEATDRTQARIEKPKRKYRWPKRPMRSTYDRQRQSLPDKGRE